MKYFGAVFALFLAIGVYSSCGYPPIIPPDCDTCKVPCDTCSSCDTCDTTKPTPSDTTSHNFTWTEYSIPEESSLRGVMVFDSNTIYITGSNLYSLEGGNWVRRKYTLQDGRNISFPNYGVFGFTRTDFWAVYGSIVKHIISSDRGFEYRLVDSGVMSLPEDGILNACWGTSSADMFFVGDKGTIVHFNGSKWKKFPKVTTKNLHSVWGTSNAVWAAGFNSTTAESVLLHFNGVTWEEIDVKTVGDIGVGRHGLFGVWSYDSSGKVFDYAYGSFVHKRINNGGWRADTLGNGLGGETYAPLNYIRGNGPSDLMVSGGGGYTAHWSGKTWKDFPELYNWNGNYDIFGMSFNGNTAAIVGYKNGQGYVAVGSRK